MTAEPIPCPINSLLVPNRPISTAGYLRKFFLVNSEVSRNCSLDSVLNLFVMRMLSFDKVKAQTMMDGSFFRQKR